MCFVLKIFRFLYFAWIWKLQILWRHYQHFCILEIHILIFLLNPIYYHDETLWNVSITYNEHSQLFLILILKTGAYSRLFLSFQPVLITQQPIIMSFKFFILLKVCTVAIKIINHQLLKVNWRHDINIFLKIINGLKLVYRLQNWTKNMLEMLFISYTNISRSFILTLNTIQEKR